MAETGSVLKALYLQNSRKKQSKKQGMQASSAGATAGEACPERSEEELLLLSAGSASRATGREPCRKSWVGKIALLHISLRVTKCEQRIERSCFENEAYITGDV